MHSKCISAEITISIKKNLNSMPQGPAPEKKKFWVLVSVTVYLWMTTTFLFSRKQPQITAIDIPELTVKVMKEVPYSLDIEVIHYLIFFF